MIDHIYMHSYEIFSEIKLMEVLQIKKKWSILIQKYASPCYDYKVGTVF